MLTRSRTTPIRIGVGVIVIIIAGILANEYTQGGLSGGGGGRAPKLIFELLK